MSSIYRRPALAAQMTKQLRNPGVLDEGLRSGLFLSGLRRTGKISVATVRCTCIGGSPVPDRS